MGKAPTRDAADTLLELLEKLPVDTLELLIEPEHLLKLLRAHGWTDADIRRDLTKGGRTPGELLLAVLEQQPDPAVLLALLGNPAPKASTPATATPRAPAPTRPSKKPIGRIIMGLLLAAPTSWFLFVKLDFLHYPTLMFAFRGAYTLMFAAIVGGVMLIGSGIILLSRGER